MNNTCVTEIICKGGWPTSTFHACHMGYFVFFFLPSHTSFFNDLIPTQIYPILPTPQNNGPTFIHHILDNESVWCI